jgi:hypothetical protein
MDKAETKSQFQNGERAYFNWFARYEESANPADYQIRLNEPAEPVNAEDATP